MSIDTAALLASVDHVALGSRYTKLQRAGRDHKGLCPFHNDRTPSFYVIPHKRFFHCQACGWNGDAIKLVMEKEGVEFKEACERLGAGNFAPLPDNVDRTKQPKPPERVTIQPPAGTLPPDMHTRHWGSPVRVWEYRDAAGALLLYVARYEYDDEGVRCKATPQWTWASLDGGKTWGWGMGHFQEPRPLYGLDRLAARPNAAVLICEGEKAADAGGELLPQYVNVTWPGGGNGVSKVDWTPLRGRRVLLWPDRDAQHYKDKDGPEKAGKLKPLAEQPGIKAMRQVAEILHDLGVAEIKTLDVGVSND